MENLKNIQPIEDFNWDALEKGDSYGESKQGRSCKNV